MANTDACLHADGSEAGRQTAAVAPAPIPASYAALRDMLRAHRVQLQIARVLMGESGQMSEFLRRVELATGTDTFWLACYAPYTDELDSAPGPELALREEIRVLRAEAVDQRAFHDSTRAVLRHLTGAKTKAKPKAKSK